MATAEPMHDCIPWHGHINASGYGVVRKHRVQSPIRAHRMVYEECFGPIPDGLVLDHLCKNKACVNPAHLEAVPQRVNVIRGDGIAAQRAAMTHCLRGHELTDENTIRTRGGRGRRCRICTNAGKRAARGRS